MNRVLKKIIYGGFYIAVVAMAVVAVNWIWRAPEPVSCHDACLTANLRIVSGKPLAFGGNESTSIVLLEVSNPNQDYGLRSLDYVFNIYHKFGVELIKFPGAASLYPGEKKYIYQSAVSLNPGDIGQIDFVAGNPNWELAADLPVRPNISVSEVKTTAALNSKAVTGLVVSDLDSKSVNVLAIGLDDDSNISAAATVNLSNLKAGQPTVFSVYLPNKNYEAVRVFGDAFTQ